MSVKKSFGRMAKIYDKYRKADELVLRVLSNEIQELRTMKNNLSMLDIGCGTGNYSIPLAKEFDIKLTGIDFSEEMLTQAQQKFPKGKWSLQDVKTVRFEDNSFDIVLMTYFVQHIQDYDQVLRMVFRILEKPFGKLLIVTDDHDQFHASFYHRYIPRILEIDLGRFPKVGDLANDLKKIGFDVNIRKVTREMRFSDINDVEELVEKGKARYFSTLTLITDKELKEGLEKMKRALINELKSGPIARTREKTILVAYQIG
ncbi:MAG: methyltransferase domain-containing protein [Candidatus Korarchaeota archaeon]|nr:methyltransferase domain-containing protein [Candidatus Korarchaeota archaeon]